MLLSKLPTRQLLRTYALAQSKKPTRQQKIDETNTHSQSKLLLLDHRFDLFNQTVTKVVDLGYAPGNWISYARNTLLQFHDVSPEKIHSKCTLVGLDIIFTQPPPGTVGTQGNIYSQAAHDNIINLLKEAAFRRINPDAKLTQDFQNSYLLKEIEESRFEAEMGELAAAFNDLSVAPNDDHLANLVGYKQYQADVILSDLSAPFLQDRGFFSNTHTKPYIRSSSNKLLRMPLSEPTKACFDLAEAALLLCCNALVKEGKFVLRLAKVDLADPELFLLETRLRRVFNGVTRWSYCGTTKSVLLRTQELFLICEDKKDYVADKYKVFDIKR